MRYKHPKEYLEVQTVDHESKRQNRSDLQPKIHRKKNQLKGEPKMLTIDEITALLMNPKMEAMESGEFSSTSFDESQSAHDQQIEKTEVYQQPEVAILRKTIKMYVLFINTLLYISIY